MNEILQVIENLVRDKSKILRRIMSKMDLKKWLMIIKVSI
jgi:hypothetical protein